MKAKHFEQESHAHFLTFSCYKRLWLFKNPDLYDLFVDHLALSRTKLGFKLWAFVVMPNHVHLLIYPDTDSSISSILYALKRPFSYHALRYLEENFPAIASKAKDIHPGRTVRRFWQRGGGYDRNIFGDQALRNTIEYINYNPVRKYLVNDPVKWRWSSARYWIKGVSDPIHIDTPWG